MWLICIVNICIVFNQSSKLATASISAVTTRSTHDSRFIEHRYGHARAIPASELSVESPHTEGPIIGKGKKNEVSLFILNNNMFRCIWCCPNYDLAEYESRRERSDRRRRRFLILFVNLLNSIRSIQIDASDSLLREAVLQASLSHDLIMPIRGLVSFSLSFFRNKYWYSKQNIYLVLLSINHLCASWCRIVRNHYSIYFTIEMVKLRFVVLCFIISCL